ncbi:unnamed protein product [Rotaria sp. Silwood1]|nr:unnamed protein product [Rotaria sp. Silwood1]
MQDNNDEDDGFPFNDLFLQLRVTSCILCTWTIADSSTLIIDTSFHQTLNNSSLISAIREFDEFIKSSSNSRINNLTLRYLISIECSDDNIILQSTHLSSIMTNK